MIKFKFLIQTIHINVAKNIRAVLIQSHYTRNTFRISNNFFKNILLNIYYRIIIDDRLIEHIIEKIMKNINIFKQNVILLLSEKLQVFTISKYS